MTLLPPSPFRVLDTDIFIDLEHKYQPALAWYHTLPTGSIALPGYTLLELYQSANNKQQMRATDLIVAGLPIVWATEAERLQAIINFRRLHLSHGLGLIDSLIAATALSHHAILCTSNVKHFRHIPGLVTEQPYPR